MARELRVLILEDVPADAEMMERGLRGSGIAFTSKSVATKEAFVRELHDFAPDVVLSDYALPQFDGMKALKLTRELLPDIPFVIVTGSINEETAADCIKAGADDYVTKGHLARIGRAVEAALEKRREREEKRRAEQALRESEERLSRAQRVARLGFWDWNIMTNDLYWSEEIYRIFGLSPQEFAVTYEAFLNAVHPDDRPFVQQSVGAAVQQDAEYSIDHRIVLPGGQVRYVHEQGEVDRGADGTPVRMVGTVIDITERKHAERALEQERQFSNAIVDTAGAMIVVLDTDGRVVRFNNACENITGYSLEEAKGRPIWEVLTPASEQEAASEAFAGLMNDTPFSAFENEWLTKDGERRLIAWTKSQVLNTDGSVRWIIGTGVDVTERRHLEEQLGRAAKLEAMGQLAGGVAHDFNNLLTAVLGYVDLNLPDIREGSPLHADLCQIRASAKRAADLTRQLLAFSRQQASQPEVLDLNGTVRNVSRMLKHLIEESIELEIVLNEEPLKVEADPAQMEQVLMNLAINARDAMPGGGRLKIETAPLELDQEYARVHHGVAPGRYVMLAVTDTGVGMPPEVQGRIFDPFFTTKEVGQGTGLGLSMVYGIVQRHAGSIQCYSEPGVGTTFRVYLPLVEGKEVAPSEETSLLVGIEGSETILVVEDEDHVRELATRALEGRGYSVLTAADGAEAVSLVREHEGRIDLVVTDVVMPKLNGPELAKEVRSVWPWVKLLFMSGYAGHTADREGQDVPDVPILQKPFSAGRLVKKVRQVLDTS